MIRSDIFVKYRDLGRELARRTSEPLRYPSFLIYFIVAVLGVGGLGFWYELQNYFAAPVGTHATLEAARTAIMTLLPALVCSSALQAILAEDRKDLRAFAFLILAESILASIFVRPASTLSDSQALAIGGVSWAIALWVWILTNADQPEFRDNISPSAPIGGDNPNAMLSGNLDEFTH